jgi:hypothetical protein
MFSYQTKQKERIGSTFQPKLKIGQPGDKYEKEADGVADKVMQMSGSETMQMQPIEEEEEVMQPKLRMQPIEEEEEAVQAKSKSVSEVAPDFTNLLNSTQGNGKTLPIQTNHFMSNAIGADFSGVQVHTDSNAVQMNQQLGARAFTHSNDIYFNKGEYNPESSAGKHLLAHELTHVVQQNGQSISPKIQCDFAVEPTHPEAAIAGLTPAQIQNAIDFNSVLFTDVDEISVIRDILGMSREPAIIDADFINGVLSYQSQYGLTQDGKLGATTAGILYNEVKAEADYLGQPASGTPLRRVERRLYLRSRVPDRVGRIAHQGFVGPDDRPNGVVTVRINANESALNPAASRAISLDYTGTDANQINWLQFVNRSFYGTQPGLNTRIYNTGNVTTSGGTYAYSRPGSVTWNLDTATAASPFYNAGGLSVRTPNRSLVMIDQPGGATPAMQNSFATSQVPNLDRLVMRATFDAYAVKNNNVVYRVRWYATYRFNLTTGAASTVSYSLGTVGTRTTLPAAQRAVLRGRFPLNTIP